MNVDESVVQEGQEEEIVFGAGVKLDYLLGVFEVGLSHGFGPTEAWHRALYHYKAVYFSKDGQDFIAAIDEAELRHRPGPTMKNVQEALESIGGIAEPEPSLASEMRSALEIVAKVANLEPPSGYDPADSMASTEPEPEAGQVDAGREAWHRVQASLANLYELWPSYEKYQGPGLPVPAMTRLRELMDHYRGWCAIRKPWGGPEGTGCQEAGPAMKKKSHVMAWGAFEDVCDRHGLTNIESRVLAQIMQDQPVPRREILSQQDAATLKRKMLVYEDDDGKWWLENNIEEVGV